MTRLWVMYSHIVWYKWSHVMWGFLTCKTFTKIPTLITKKVTTVTHDLIRWKLDCHREKSSLNMQVTIYTTAFHYISQTAKSYSNILKLKNNVDSQKTPILYSTAPQTFASWQNKNTLTINWLLMFYTLRLIFENIFWNPEVATKFMLIITNISPY
jgi:hypothetical protein